MLNLPAFVCVSLLAVSFGRVEAVAMRSPRSLTTLAPSLINPKVKTTVASAAAAAVCPAPSICNSRNCCSYYCNTATDPCLMITGKPFCVDAVNGPYNAPTCTETRCLGCAVNSIPCGNLDCATIVAPAMVCDFSSIRGPLPQVG
ncbi:uncharacterized protein LOC110859676 [Folsomia candida]|uniref:Uncharacterized protein n=1 Tax=Folsomia candida TaxID=158441 RepID=A0A226DAB2_FOLCA|nr:uncharacterized protein LOC110859676 [Folsomia candida]OXA42103.1 hypothetical protein Fcan01_23052 [Folsomia candida]